jgi:hypothetical protein
MMYCDAEKSSRRRAVQYVLSQVSPYSCLCLILDPFELSQHALPIDTHVYRGSVALYP